MARPLRIEYENALYHVTSRGNAKQPIYLDDQDRKIYLDILSQVVERYKWICHAYCLMDNHYHLIVETPQANLSRGMRQLNGVYTQKFNWHHQRVGHIFQGRYKAIVVEKEAYLLELTRYVVLNPVRAEMAQNPEDWPWSSYRATAGLGDLPEFLTVDWVLGQFSDQRRQAQDLYRVFVEEGRGEKLMEEIKGGIFLGSKAFVEKLGPRLEERVSEKEFPKVQRLAARPALGQVFQGGNKGEISERDRLIYKAVHDYGYTLREVGEFLGLHYSTVSKACVRARTANQVDN